MPGGRHADGKTENRLVLFRDGSYLELIAFIRDDPEKRKGHFWDMPFGIVDFALTTREPLDHSALQERLKASGSGVSYATPKEGGRVTADGQELKWKVTFPEGIRRGAVPFFCQDVTPRPRRVPAANGNTYHPCGAVGLTGVIVEVSDSLYGRIDPALAAITNTSAMERGKYPIATPFEIGRPDQETILLRQRPLDNEKEMQLRLMVQCPGRGSQPNIERKIGDGVVLIEFVNGDTYKVV